MNDILLGICPNNSIPDNIKFTPSIYLAKAFYNSSKIIFAKVVNTRQIANNI